MPDDDMLSTATAVITQLETTESGIANLENAVNLLKRRLCMNVLDQNLEKLMVEGILQNL